MAIDHSPENFTVPGALAGMRQSGPLVLSTFAYGLVFGVLARQAGLSPVESLLMSGFVFAGTAQFVALTLWSTPLPALTIILTTLIVNLRYVLMSAALRPWFARISAFKTYVSAFFLGDENWALAVRHAEQTAGGGDRAFMLGGGLALFMAWTSATAIGQSAGAALKNPQRWGLDFVFTAVFVALLVDMWKGKGDFLPWLVAAGVALAAAAWLPGTWHILLGGLAGSLAGGIRDAG